MKPKQFNVLPMPDIGEYGRPDQSSIVYTYKIHAGDFSAEFATEDFSVTYETRNRQ